MTGSAVVGSEVFGSIVDVGSIVASSGTGVGESEEGFGVSRLNAYVQVHTLSIVHRRIQHMHSIPSEYQIVAPCCWKFQDCHIHWCTASFRWKSKCTISDPCMEWVQKLNV